MAVRGTFSRLEQAYVLAVMSDSVLVAGISNPTDIEIGVSNKEGVYEYSYYDFSRMHPAKRALTIEYSGGYSIKQFKGAVDLSPLVREIESRAELRVAKQRLKEAEDAVNAAKKLLNQEQEKALYARGSNATAEEVVRNL